MLVRLVEATYNGASTILRTTQMEMGWLADWDGEKGTKDQHRENGSDGQ